MGKWGSYRKMGVVVKKRDILMLQVYLDIQDYWDSSTPNAVLYYHNRFPNFFGFRILWKTCSVNWKLLVMERVVYFRNNNSNFLFNSCTVRSGRCTLFNFSCLLRMHVLILLSNLCLQAKIRLRSTRSNK